MEKLLFVFASCDGTCNCDNVYDPVNYELAYAKQVFFRGGGGGCYQKFIYS